MNGVVGVGDCREQCLPLGDVLDHVGEVAGAILPRAGQGANHIGATNDRRLNLFLIVLVFAASQDDILAGTRHLDFKSVRTDRPPDKVVHALGVHALAKDAHDPLGEAGLLGRGHARIVDLVEQTVSAGEVDAVLELLIHGPDRGKSQCRDKADEDDLPPDITFVHETPSRLQLHKGD